MNIKIKELSKTNIKFTLYSQVSFANSLRRILLGEVPNTAIDVIEIRENRSVLPDEMIANRLGLVPIRHFNTLISKEECECDEFCDKCSIRFTLKKHNDTDSIISVTGQDLVTDTQGVFCHNTLLLKLAPGQGIDMKCIATLGTPQKHVKYCSVTAVGFVYDPRNKTRETKLWTEQDVKSEWPNINQSDETDWKEVEEIEMNVEVVEGMGKPKEVLLRALEIYRDKIEEVLDSMN